MVKTWFMEYAINPTAFAAKVGSHWNTDCNLYQWCETIYDWTLGRECSVGRGAACKRKRGGFPRICFFFRLLFGLLGDFVCCRCCCCFLLYLLCFFTLHGCYLKVTYKEHIIHDHFFVGYFHVCAILIPFYRCPYSTAHLSLINCHFLLCSSSIERLSRNKLKNVLDVNYRILFCVPDGNSES